MEGDKTKKTTVEVAKTVSIHGAKHVKKSNCTAELEISKKSNTHSTKMVGGDSLLVKDMFVDEEDKKKKSHEKESEKQRRRHWRLQWWQRHMGKMCKDKRLFN